MKDIPVFLLLAFFYTFSSLFLLCGYGYMGAGVATTLHFTYPVFVSLLMFLLFREKASWLTWVSIAMAVCGVALLSLPSTGMSADVKGIIIVILSAVAYGSYIVGVNKSRVRNMNSRKLAFYVFIFTTVIFGVKDLASGSLQMPPDISSVGNLVLLAVSGRPAYSRVQHNPCARGAEYRRYADFRTRGFGAAHGRVHRSTGLRGGFHHEGGLRNSACAGSRDSDHTHGVYTGDHRQGIQENTSPPCLIYVRHLSGT